MLFTLLFTVSVTFTIHTITKVAYTDEKENIYEAIEIKQEKSIKDINKKEIKEIKSEVIQNKNLITNNRSFINIDNISPRKIKASIKPIKIIPDPWFMQHYNRICELEAISHKSVLDMYDHDPLFSKFPDLKGLARNLAWELQQQKQKVR